MAEKDYVRGDYVRGRCFPGGFIWEILRPGYCLGEILSGGLYAWEIMPVSRHRGLDVLLRWEPITWHDNISRV